MLFLFWSRLAIFSAENPFYYLINECGTNTVHHLRKKLKCCSQTSILNKQLHIAVYFAFPRAKSSKCDASPAGHFCFLCWCRNKRETSAKKKTTLGKVGLALCQSLKLMLIVKLRIMTEGDPTSPPAGPRERTAAYLYVR